MNPVQDYLEIREGASGEKVASGRFQALKTFGTQVGKGLTSGVGAALATGAIAGTTLAASKVYDALTKSRDFKALLDPNLNPDLHEAQQKNPQFFNAAFSSLRRMQPEFSKDPLVAGSLMRQMMDNPASAGGVLINNVVPSRSQFPNWVRDKMLDTSGQAIHKAINEDEADRNRAHLEGFRAHLSDENNEKQHSRQMGLEAIRAGFADKNNANQFDRQMAMKNKDEKIQRIRRDWASESKDEKIQRIRRDWASRMRK